MKNEHLLEVGNDVIVTTVLGEVISGRVKSRAGGGERDNFILSEEVIKLENENGCSYDISFSLIEKVD